MASKFKTLQLKLLDKQLAKVNICETPSMGWIASIRKALGMSMRQMGERIGITQQSIATLESNERDGSITLKSLHKAAAALDCHVAYVLIPNDKTLENILKKQAIIKAKESILAVNHTMELEGQASGNVELKIQEKAEELSQDPNFKLWD